MNPKTPHSSTSSNWEVFQSLRRRLGEAFVVRDIMVGLSDIKCAAPGDSGTARSLACSLRYSVVPASNDGRTFPSVFRLEQPADQERPMTEEATSIADYIPDSTPLSEAFSLFKTREWYLTLFANHVSGLITYWEFNKREFRLQLYSLLSRVEELSRDALANDGCGIRDANGLNLSPKVLDRAFQQFKSAQDHLGGNRLVDELQFHHVSEALKKHKPWREYLKTLKGDTSQNEYERMYDFTELRNAVMHGRTLFNTYSEFQERSSILMNIEEMIELLDQYHEKVGKHLEE